MLGAVCADVFAQLTDGIAQAVASSTSPLDALAEAGRCYVQFGLEHPEHYRLVFMRPPFKGDLLDHSELRPVLEAGVIPESHPLFSGDALGGLAGVQGALRPGRRGARRGPATPPARRVHRDDVDVDGDARHHVAAHQQARLRLAVRRGPDRRHPVAVARATTSRSQVVRTPFWAASGIRKSAVSRPVRGMVRRPPRRGHHVIAARPGWPRGGLGRRSRCPCRRRR